jgi:PilZ domain
MQQYPRTRRVQRVHLPQPLIARLGTAQIVIVDISVLGARIEHAAALAAGSTGRLAFRWEEDDVSVDCRIVRSRLERFSVGADGMTVYHSGLEFVNVVGKTKAALKNMIGIFITRALEEQKMNARGVVPKHAAGKMPIFRHGGQLTANSKDVKEAVGSSVLPTSRLAKDSGYVCYQWENNGWKQKRTHDPGQPAQGFTISALEDVEQVHLLCDAYARSDEQGRKMIQLFAQLSIAEGEGISPGRFRP